jgi:hypothetical protein
MAGAGGGGFVFALTKEADAATQIAALVDSANLNMRIYQAQVSKRGIELRFQ